MLAGLQELIEMQSSVTFVAADFGCTRNAMVLRALFAQSLSFGAPDALAMHTLLMEDLCQWYWLMMNSLISQFRSSAT